MTDATKLARGIVELDISHDPKIDKLISDFRTSIGSTLYHTDLNRLTDRQLAEIDMDAVGRFAFGSAGFYQAALTIAKRNYVSGRWRLAPDVKYWSDWVESAMPDPSRIGAKTSSMLRRIRTILTHYIPAVCDPLMKQPLLIDGKLIGLGVEGNVAEVVDTGKTDRDGNPITRVVTSGAPSEIFGLTREELADFRTEGVEVIDPLEAKPSLFEELGPVVRSLDPVGNVQHRELFDGLMSIGATKSQKELRAKLSALPLAPAEMPPAKHDLDECEVAIYNEVDPKGKVLRTITEYRVKCTNDHNAAFVDLQLHGKFKILPPLTEQPRIIQH